MSRLSHHRAGVVPLLLGALVLSTIIVVAFFTLGGSEGAPSRPGQDTFVVRRGGFDITLPASGELAALRQIEIRNRLESQAVITSIVPEGETVKAGEVLVRLADKDIRNRIKDAEDEVTTAQAALTTAESTLDLLLKSQKAELEKAQLAIELAEIALQAWEKGEVVSKRKELALGMETARKNYDRLLDRYEQSKKLYEQTFISLDELKQDEISMIEAKARVEQAEIDIQVYEDYLYHQEKKQHESDLEQAREERSRIEQRYATEVNSARVEVGSKKHQLESRQERLADLREQLEHCTVEAPSDGLVVYATSLEDNGWRNDGQPPQVGTELRSNELVIVLPDTSRMIAAVKVNESLSGMIQPGQRAIVTSDAVPDVALRGEVQSIGVLAESGGWRDPNRRDYTVRILLDDTNELSLKPSMRCKAEIAVGRVDDATYVPIQAVFRSGAEAFVHTPRGGMYERRIVQVGRASELFVEITSGLKEGELVLLREPKADEIIGGKQTETRERDWGVRRGGPGEPVQPGGEATGAPGESGEAGGSGGSGGVSEAGEKSEGEATADAETSPAAKGDQPAQ